ncbi:MAG: polysaccharide lyase [Myxococcota bacterium]
MSSSPVRWVVLAGALQCAGLALSPTAHAAPEWVGDLETGDFSQWTQYDNITGNPAGFAVVEDPVFEGQYAAQISLSQGDVAVGGLTRNELEYSPDAASFEGSERYYSVALRTDDPWGNDWHSLWYWEGNPVFAPVMTLNAIGPQLQFRTFLGGDQELWNAPFTPGQWHEFILHVRWSPDPAVGFVELYYGGDVVVPMTSVQTMHGEGVPNFMHAGILRSENIGLTEILYVDGARAGATLEDVMPGVDGGTDDGTDDGIDDTGDAADDTGDDGPMPGSDAGDDAADQADDGADDQPDDGADDSTPTSGATDGGTSGAANDDGDGGCSCTASPGRAALWLLTPLLLGLRRRRHGVETRRGRRDTK